jgi:DNA polymerase
MATLAIDLETYSSNDIRQGSRKYVDTPDFELLLMGYSFDDDPVTVVDLTSQPFPERVRAALYDPDVLKTAFNANFEMTCFRRVFPDLPLAGWECTSVLSLYNSLPARLEDVARILHLGEDKQKDARGKALIRFFSIPCRPTKANGGRTRNYPADDPAKWAEYIEYNRQDVVVEKAIRRRLLGLRPPQEEKRLWYLDQRINNDGITIDRQLVANAIRLNTEYREKIMDEARTLTGLDNPNSVIQLKDWLATRISEPLESLDKKAVKGLLDRPGIPQDVQRLLRIRQLLGKTSIKKYEAMAGSVCGDGRIHNMFMFYGASRLGRFSGRNVQLQNLARNSMPDLDTAREVVKGGDLGTLEMLYDNVPDVLSQLIRTALIAPEGSRFIVADFSAIEARVIAWLAGEQWRMDAFRAGRDIYCESASQMFGVPVVKHGINGELRAKGKVAELACGYGGGPGALIQMGALDQGLEEADLPGIVRRWREASPQIVRFWHDAENAAMRCVKTGRPVRIKQGGVLFRVAHGALFLELPSGRHLVYIHPAIGENRFGGESITYMGMEQQSHVWARQETYGGKLAENLTQAIARDCLTAAMLRLDEAGYRIVAHVHDEAIMEMPDGTGSLEEAIRIMTRNEGWNQGLVMDADGFETKYYKKD